MDFADQASRAERHYLQSALSARTVAPLEEQCVEHGRVVCLECGDPIPQARLAVLPDAVRCRDCQEEADQC